MELSASEPEDSRLGTLLDVERANADRLLPDGAVSGMRYWHIVFISGMALSAEAPKTSTLRWLSSANWASPMFS